MTDLENTGAAFDATRWTLIDALRAGDEHEKRRVMERLVETYWPPAYAFLRKTGRGRERAAEITQGFFVTKVIEKGLFEKADRARGGLRALLLHALKNYVRDLERRERSRGNGHAAVGGMKWNVEEEEAGIVELLEDPQADTPEAAFELRWALRVLEQTMERSEKHCRSAGLDRHWGAAEEWFIRPSLRQVGRPTTSELADKWGFGKPEAVCAAMQVVRRHCQSRLMEVVAETVSRDGLDDEAYWQAVQEEYGRVVRLLGGGPSMAK